MFRRAAPVLLLALLTAVAAARPPEATAGAWTSVRSENFTFVGGAGAARLRELAADLEEFRAVLRQLLPSEYFDRQAPTVVVVFSSDEEYRPFKPVYDGHADPLVAGYFKPGRDLDYITLAAGGTLPEAAVVLRHEYVHALVRSAHQGRAPVWFDEGLAEYHTELALSADRRRARTGQRLARRALHFRGRALLPLASVLEADRTSPLYREHDRRGIFYAQSWALVHYLLADRAGERQRQLAEFLRLTAAGAATDAAVRRAFGVERVTLEARLAAYVRAGRYSERVETLGERPQIAPPSQAVPLSAAEVQARLGDLLLRTDRPEEAAGYLRAAVALDPSLAPARLSLGLLHLHEGRTAEATEEMRLAAEADPRSHLAHYYHAALLRLDSADADSTVAGYAARTALIRAELRRAVELAPDFADARALLVLSEIERSPALAEAEAELARLARLAPTRRDLHLLRAQLDLRRGEFADARARLDALLADARADAGLLLEARRALDDLPRLERLAGERRRQAESDGAGEAEAAAAAAPPAAQPCDMPEPGPQLKQMRFSGRQACGRLVSVECDGAAVVLSVRAGDRVLRLRAASLGRVRFVTYTSEVRTGKFECGERAAPEAVLVTYRPQVAGDLLLDGELTAVEFVPADWLTQGDGRSGGN